MVASMRDFMISPSQIRKQKCCEGETHPDRPSQPSLSTQLSRADSRNRLYPIRDNFEANSVLPHPPIPWIIRVCLISRSSMQLPIVSYPTVRTRRLCG